MSINSDALGRKSLKRRTAFSDTNLLLIITIAVFIVMYICAVVFLKKGFTKPQTFFNILNENASLLVLSCGMTLVMITGGIDISVGQVTSLVCMACAVHLEQKGGNVITSMLLALGIGLAFGIVQGFLVASGNPAVHCHSGGPLLRQRSDDDHKQRPYQHNQRSICKTL